MPLRTTLTSRSALRVPELLDAGLGDDDVEAVSELILDDADEGADSNEDESSQSTIRQQAAAGTSTTPQTRPPGSSG